MKRKHIWMAVAETALCATLLMACGVPSSASANKTSGAKKTITLWAGGSDNVRTQFNQQVEKFNSTNKLGYTVKLEFILSGTGAQGLSDRVIAAEKAGQKNTDFDVIELGDDEFLNYTTQGGAGIFSKLDKSKIVNYKNLKTKPTFGADYVVPYRGTTVVLAYNSATVSTPPKTTDELYSWIKAHPGRFAYNTPDSGGAGSSFVMTTVYNYLSKDAMTSTDKKWEDQWDQGFAKLKELAPYMYKSGGKVVYPNKNQGTLDLLANKEVDMIPAWADMVISQKSQGTLPDSIKMTQLTPSFTGSTVTFGIPSIGSNPDGAYAFIDYMLTPQAQNIALKSMAAIPVIDISKLDSSLTGTISGLKVDTFRMGSIGPLGTDLNTRWSKDIGSATK